MASNLIRVGAVAGVFTDSSPDYLDYADDDLLELVEDGDVLLVVAYGASLSAPGGTGWTQRWSSGNWKAWTKSAVAREAFPIQVAADGGNDPAGALLVYRRGSIGYLVGAAAQRNTTSTTTHATSSATVLDPNGLLLGLWLGAAAGPEPDAMAAPIDTILAGETTNASGGGVRWFVVGERPIAVVPTAGTLTLITPSNDSMKIAIVPLRDRPPHLPGRLVDSGAGANIGLLP